MKVNDAGRAVWWWDIFFLDTLTHLCVEKDVQHHISMTDYHLTILLKKERVMICHYPLVPTPSFPSPLLLVYYLTAPFFLSLAFLRSIFVRWQSWSSMADLPNLSTISRTSWKATTSSITQTLVLSWRRTSVAPLRWEGIYPVENAHSFESTGKVHCRSSNAHTWKLVQKQNKKKSLWHPMIG